MRRGQQTQRSHLEAGFTLVELVVVVTVLGILLAIAAVTFLGSRGKASDTAAKARVTEALKAQRVIYTNAQEYGTAEELEVIEPSLSYTDGAVVAGKVYVRVDGDAVTLAARSRTDTCYWIRDTAAVSSYASAPCDVDPATLIFTESW